MMLYLSAFPYFFVSAIALLVNIPLGFFRGKTKKFSPAWFFWVHASIPFIIFLRYKFELENWIIPVNIALAVGGQIVGKLIYVKRAKSSL